MADEKLFSPQSVRLGIATIREWCGCESVEAFLEQVNRRAVRDYVGQGRSRSAWERVEKGKSAVGYGHLEWVQDVSGVPTGVFLTSTHVAFALREGHQADLVRFAAGLAAIAEEIQRLAKRKGKATEEELQTILCSLFETWVRRGINISVGPKRARRRKVDKKGG